MKLIVALIQPYKLEDVKKALVGAKVTKMTVSPAQGCGQQVDTPRNIEARSRK